MKLKKMQIHAKRKERDHTDETQHVVSRINQQISFLRSLMTRIDTAPLHIRDYTIYTMRPLILNSPVFFPLQGFFYRAPA